MSKSRVAGNVPHFCPEKMGRKKWSEILEGDGLRWRGDPRRPRFSPPGLRPWRFRAGPGGRNG